MPTEDRCPRCDRPQAECEYPALSARWRATAADDPGRRALCRATDLAYADCFRHEVSRETWRSEALAGREWIAALEAALGEACDAADRGRSAYLSEIDRWRAIADGKADAR